MWDAQQTMNDFKKVRDELFRKVRPYQLAARHAKTRHFIQAKLEEPFDGPTVVVTHHAPSELSLHQRYREAPGHLNSSYASNLEHMLGSAALWVHGHTHDSADYTLSDTRVVCNPRGYAPGHVNPDFEPGLVLEV